MTTPDVDTDSLIELQLQVARRADALAASIRAQGSLNLPCWLQAEEEILGLLRSLASTGASDRPISREEGTSAPPLASLAAPSVVVA